MKNLFGLNKPKQEKYTRKNFLHICIDPLGECKKYQTHGTKNISKREIHEVDIVHYFIFADEHHRVRGLKVDQVFVDDGINIDVREFLK